MDLLVPFSNTLCAKSQNHTAWSPIPGRVARPWLNLQRFSQVSWRHLTWGKQLFCSHNNTEWEGEDQKPDCNWKHPLKTIQKQFTKMWSTRQSTVGFHCEADAGAYRRGKVWHQAAALWNTLNIYNLTEYPRLLFCRRKTSRISCVWFDTPPPFFIFVNFLHPFIFPPACLFSIPLALFWFL